MKDRRKSLSPLCWREEKSYISLNPMTGLILFMPLSAKRRLYLSILFFIICITCNAVAQEDPRVTSLVKSMSIEEKARQLILTPASQDLLRASNTVPVRDEPDLQRWIAPGIGALLVDSEHSANNTSAWIHTHSRLGILPFLVTTDALGKVELPLGATWDADLARQTAIDISRRERTRGISAAVLPLANFTAGAISADNAMLLGVMTKELSKGLQQGNMASIPAYFPLGMEKPAGSVHGSGERELRMNLLPAFQPWTQTNTSTGLAISAGEIDGEPIVVSTNLLREILRTEWGFQGFTLAAPGSIRALSESEHETASSSDAICQAINSGIDMQWGDYDAGTFANAISDCVRNGVISMNTLDRAVGSVLQAKLRVGILDASPASPQPVPDVSDTAEKLAAESIVLLRNDHSLLPLASTIRSIMIVEPPSPDSIAASLQKLLPQAQIITSADKDIAATSAQAKNAEAVIVVLRDGDVSGNDIVKQMLSTNPDTIIILEDKGAPSLQGEVGKAAAILEAWKSGEAEPHAIADALTGAINPAGKLPMSLSSGQRFPLGFGLSYTTFRYSNLAVKLPELGSKEGLEVAVTVTNSGKVAGDEVAQLYLHHNVSSVHTADRVLVGFMRIHLAPDESRTISFKIHQQQLAVWNAQRQWSVEPGPYTLFAGSSSNAQLCTEFSMGQPSWARASTSNTDHWIFAPMLETRGTSVAEFSAAYQLAVRVMEYNLRGGLLEAGKGYGTWTRDSSINAWNAASLLTPDVARRTLWHQTEATPDGPIVGGQYWDKVIWIIAAYNHVLVTGDHAFLDAAYGVAKRTLAAMRNNELDPHTGLFRGPAVYGDGVAAYPDPPFNDKQGDNVMDYSEAAALETLSTNSVYYGAYRAAAAMGRMEDAPRQETDAMDVDAASLRLSIQSILWIQDAHRFGYFRSTSGVIDTTQEALGEALAITLGITTGQQAHAIFRHAEVTPWGIACTWKPYHRYFDPTDTKFGRHNGTIWPFINAFWATAAASTGEPATFAREFVDVTKLALHSDDFREIYHPYTGAPYGGYQVNKTWDSVWHQTWSATGYLRMVYQGLFGMRFEDNSLHFEPVVPASLGLSSITLRGMKYRQAELNITIRGTGSRIQRSTLDGAPLPSAAVSASLVGTHDLEIILSGPPQHTYVATSHPKPAR